MYNKILLSQINCKIFKFTERRVFSLKQASIRSLFVQSISEYLKFLIIKYHFRLYLRPLLCTTSNKTDSKWNIYSLYTTQYCLKYIVLIEKFSQFIHNALDVLQTRLFRNLIPKRMSFFPIQIITYRIHFTWRKLQDSTNGIQHMFLTVFFSCHQIT